jgi:hypothetical protein
MQISEKRKDFSTMSAREMFSLWWHERWIRYLVISLSPIGFIDASYTLMLYLAHGADYEYNPIVRAALTSGLWPLWFMVDVLSFSLFAMIAGSYYLHTRSKIFGVRTGWLAALVALRVGAAVYNILLYYNAIFLNTVSIPALGGLIVGAIVYVIVGGLLSRSDDVSVEGFKAYIRAKYDRIQDRLLMRGLKTKEEQVKPVVEPTSRAWYLKRAGYLAMAVIVFVSVPFILQLISDITGLSHWAEIYGDLWFFNELSARGFMVGFIGVIVMLCLMMYFILKAFSADESEV